MENIHFGQCWKLGKPRSIRVYELRGKLARGDSHIDVTF